MEGDFVPGRVISFQHITLSSQPVGSPDSFHTAESQEADMEEDEEDVSVTDSTDSTLINQLNQRRSNQTSCMMQ